MEPQIEQIVQRKHLSHHNIKRHCLYLSCGVLLLSLFPLSFLHFLLKRILFISTTYVAFSGLSWHLLLFFFCYIPLKGTQKQHRRQLADLLLVHQRDVLYTDRQERAYVACCMELHHTKSLFMRDATLRYSTILSTIPTLFE